MWGTLTQLLLSSSFITVALFVIVGIEIIKTFVGENVKWFSTIMPFIALLLSIFGVLTLNITHLTEWKEWVLQGITQAFLVDLFYTYCGKPVIKLIKYIWDTALSKMTNMADQK